MPRLVAVCISFVIALVSLAVVPPGDGVAQAVSEGNSYASGTYGFELGWDDRIWYVVGQELDEESETVSLSDGTAFLDFFAGPGYGGDAQTCIADISAELTNSRQIANLQPALDNDGAPIEMNGPDRAFAAFTFSADYGNDTMVDIARYFECQTLVPGESVVIADVNVQEAEFETELNLARDVIETLVLPSQGEPAPVFVSEGWRIAVAGVEQGAEIEAAGLAPRDEDEWLVLVVDVTNLQADRAELSVRDFTLWIDGSQDPISIAPSSTVAAADELGTGPSSANRAVAFRSDQTRRLTLAYLVPPGASNPVLLLTGRALPLSQVLASEQNLADLRPVVTPPFMREVQVNEVLSGGQLRVTFTSDGVEEFIELVGIDGLKENDCYGQSFLDAIGSVVGETVMFEPEPTRPGRDPISGYLWTTSNDDLLVQLNQQLLAAGDATLSDTADDTRFSAWLTESEQEAERAQRGLWSACT